MPKYWLDGFFDEEDDDNFIFSKFIGYKYISISEIKTNTQSKMIISNNYFTSQKY